MKRRALFIIALFFSFVLLFALQKPFFMLYNRALAGGTGIGDWIAVVWHGLSLDMTVAGYFTVIPALIALISVWWGGDRLWRSTLRVYIIIVALISAIIFAADMALYSYWGYRMDATIWFYLRSPRDAAASATLGEAISQIIIGAAYFLVFYYFIVKLILPLFEGAPLRGIRRRLAASAVTLALAGSLFFPIRGGLGASTANEGRVYFSSNQFLNHSAVNPVFSLLSSSLRQQSYAAQYHFMDEGECAAIFAGLVCRDEPADTACLCGQQAKILNTTRPNIILILLESFSANVVEPLGGKADITPNLNALAAEGVLFSGIYSNSYRTDRGLVSVLNAFPGQPTTSIMKYPAKSRTLPSIAAALKGEGYSTAMYYGGDIDFTNMRSYFYSSGYDKVVGQDGLRIKAKPSQWGYDDRQMFEWLSQETLSTAAMSDAPFFITFLTLSSHEPFEVPFSKFDHPYVNSVAFADDCLGDYVSSLKAGGLWEETLLILVSDHSFRYPRDIVWSSPEHYHIPMVWSGGAVCSPEVNDRTGNQVDLAATLMGQLSLPRSEFIYSKDLFSDNCPRYAFYTYNNGFTYLDDTGVTMWDCTSDAPTLTRGQQGSDSRASKGKALLQTLMADFDRR